MRKVRSFWVRHAIQCRRICAYIAEKLNDHVLCNVWIPDGYKDVPADRLAPRLRLKKSLDEIFAEKLPASSTVWRARCSASAWEAYTVGSSEFYISYAGTHPGVYDLLDNGHYHPTEVVSDKIPSLLAFFDKVPLHVTRGVRWDSDHVVLYEDELKEIAKEIVRNGRFGSRAHRPGLLRRLHQPHRRLGGGHAAAWKKRCSLPCFSRGAR